MAVIKCEFCCSASHHIKHELKYSYTWGESCWTWSPPLDSSIAHYQGNAKHENNLRELTQRTTTKEKLIPLLGPLPSITYCTLKSYHN